MPILYYIIAKDPDMDDDDLDLFVTANDDIEAVRLWREHFALMIDSRPISTFSVRLVRVPQVAETAHAHSWHTEVQVDVFSRNVPGGNQAFV